jgi:quinol monooxygenase YgiN
MELSIVGRVHARPGDEGAVEEALRDVVGPSREESGCLSIHAFPSIRDPRVFYIHSRWVDEAAFDHHAGLPHTTRFIEPPVALAVEACATVYPSSSTSDACRPRGTR